MRKRLIEIFILTLSGLAIILIHQFTLNTQKRVQILPEIPEYQPTIKYGIIIDSLEIIKEKIKKNEFLADILVRHDVDYNKIDLAVKRAKPIFDVRHIQTGHNYSILRTNDSLKEVQYFVYENSPTFYIVFDLRDSIHVHAGNKEVKIRMSQLEGVITSSLWNAIVDQDGDPNLANELSEIFAWTIDFFGIQKGDAFKVIYEELLVGDQKIGLGKIHAAQFNHAKEDHYAFYFVQDSVGDYFDDKGGSLRRAFLKAPLHFKRISSRFSHSRLHPVLKIRRPHTGIDYAAAVGTPVHTVGDGTVVEMNRTREGGNTIRVKHNGTYSTRYLHLSRYAKGMKVGKKVKQGELIAYVGKTGLVSGPHLDFRFYRNGKAVDPLKVKSPPVNPVDSTYLAAFLEYKDSMILKLDSVGMK